PRPLVTDDERAGRLEVEQRNATLAANAVDLGAKRSVARPPRMRHVLEERALLDEPLELLLGDEVVLAAVPLAGTPLPRGRRDGELELGEATHELLLERALAGTRGTGDRDDGTRVRGRGGARVSG